MYKFIKAYNFIVWGITENAEITSFSSRDEDEFRGFIHGRMNYETKVFRLSSSRSFGDRKKHEKKQEKKFQLSTIGYLMFNNYYVNLDQCVPIPFI
jgi:hypothetical protein